MLTNKPRFSRRDFMKAAAALGVAGLANPEFLFAADSEKDWLARTIEGAKKEGGKVVVYTTPGTPKNEDLNKALQKDFPFLTVEMLQIGSSGANARFQAEYKADNMKADIVSSSLGAENSRLGMAADLSDIPNFQKYPAKFKFPEAHWVSIQTVTVAPGYNTRLVKKEDAPKTYSDLLDRKWAGKLAMDINPTWAPVWWITEADKSNKLGWDYWKKMVENKNPAGGQDSNLATYRFVGLGEFPVTIYTYPYLMYQPEMKPLPLNWIRLPVVPIVPLQFVISKKAPHMNSAKLFAHWYMSNTGQELLKSLGFIPGNTNIGSNPPEILKGDFELEVIPVHKLDLGAIAKKFKEIVPKY